MDACGEHGPTLNRFPVDMEDHRLLAFDDGMRRSMIRGGLAVGILAVAIGFGAGQLAAAQPFPQCPPVDADKSCQFLITVTNAGSVTLSNLVVFDSNSSDGKVLNLTGCGFPATLAVGATASCTVTTNHCVNSTNIVTATGVGQNSTGGNTTVSATDTNTVAVLPISVTCEFQILTNGVTVPGACPKFLVNTTYTVRLVVRNNGQYPLQNVTVTNVTGFVPSCDCEPECTVCRATPYRRATSTTATAGTGGPADPGQITEWAFSPSLWSEIACASAGHALTSNEWQEYVGPGEPAMPSQLACGS